jgi:flagellar biosynthesis protein FliQ
MLTLTRNYVAQARAASSINVLLGIWLLVSPWFFGYSAVGLPAILNSVIVGTLVALLAASRQVSPPTSTNSSYLIPTLALWTIASPWMYGYAANLSGRRDNVVLGIVMAALAIWSCGASTAEQKHLSGARAH